MKIKQKDIIDILVIAALILFLVFFIAFAGFMFKFVYFYFTR